MPTFDDSTTTTAPVEEVWKLLYDPSRMPEWWEGIETVEGHGRDGKGDITIYPRGYPEMQLAGSGNSGNWESGSLFGTPESCWNTVQSLAAMGVDDIACLIDFGIDFDATMGGFRHLARLSDLVARSPGVLDRPQLVSSP